MGVAQGSVWREQGADLTQANFPESGLSDVEWVAHPSGSLLTPRLQQLRQSWSPPSEPWERGLHPIEGEGPTGACANWNCVHDPVS